MSEEALEIDILWGDHPDRKKRIPTKYTFSTEAELFAFMTGVRAMEGWERYEVITTARVFSVKVDDLRYQYLMKCLVEPLCQSCGREEAECSADPCPGAQHDRDSFVTDEELDRENKGT